MYTLTCMYVYMHAESPEDYAHINYISAPYTINFKDDSPVSVSQLMPVVYQPTLV